jgi:hypothetical protein
MPTETVHPAHVSRLSITTALGGFALFVVLILFLREPPVQLSLAEVPATDQWKYSPEGRAAKLVELRAREQEQAQKAAWVDKEKGVVRLPLQTAMKLTLQEINSKRDPGSK